MPARPEWSPWASPGHPLRGGGLDLAFLDGIVRLDLARSSAGRFRGALYFEPR